MKEKEEVEFHRKMKTFEGKYEIKTNWGKISLSFEAIPRFAGGKGRPDELLLLRAEFALLGTIAKAAVPILIELEKTGFSDARVDLEEYCKRSISGEEISYLEVPMIIVGGAYKELAPQERQVVATFNLTEVPKRIV
jgi:hypothetical protein